MPSSKIHKSTHLKSEDILQTRLTQQFYILSVFCLLSAHVCLVRQNFTLKRKIWRRLFTACMHVILFHFHLLLLVNVSNFPFPNYTQGVHSLYWKITAKPFSFPKLYPGVHSFGWEIIAKHFSVSKTVPRYSFTWLGDNTKNSSHL